VAQSRLPPPTHGWPIARIGVGSRRNDNRTIVESEGSNPYQARARSSRSAYVFGSTSTAACPSRPRLITSTRRLNSLSYRGRSYLLWVGSFSALSTTASRPRGGSNATRRRPRPGASRTGQKSAPSGQRPSSGTDDEMHPSPTPPGDDEITPLGESPNSPHPRLPCAASVIAT